MIIFLEVFQDLGLFFVDLRIQTNFTLKLRLKLHIDLGLVGKDAGNIDVFNFGGFSFSQKEANIDLFVCVYLKIILVSIFESQRMKVSAPKVASVRKKTT